MNANKKRNFNFVKLNILKSEWKRISVYLVSNK